MEVTGGMVFVEGYSLVVSGGGTLATGPYWISLLSGPASTTNFQINSADTDSSDNLYATAFHTNTGSASNIVLVKYDTTGNVTWARSLNGNSQDYSYVTRVDSSGNQYVFGTSNSSGGAGLYDFIVAKYNTTGDIQWQKSLGAAALSEGSDGIFGLSLDSSDNSYYAGSSTNGNVIIFKYNPTGTLQWQRSLGASAITEDCTSLVLDSNNDIYTFGTTTNGNNYYLTKLTDSGNITFQVSIGTVNDNYAREMAISSSGNLYCTGYSIVSGVTVVNVFKCDNTTGNVVWARKLEENANYYIGAPQSISTDSSENIYVVGSMADKATGQQDIMLYKYNSSGVIQWQRRLADSNVSVTDGMYSLSVTSSGDLVLSGYRAAASQTPKTLVVKLPNDGSLTGTYGSYVYESVSLPESALTLTSSALSMAYTSASLTENTRNLSNVAFVVTNSITTIP